LEEFGEIYIRFVRDTVLKQMISIINGESKALASKILYNNISAISSINKKHLEEVLIHTVDKCLHYTLFMLEEYQDQLKLTIKNEDAKDYSLVEISDGLCGELYTRDGWVKKYSNYSPSDQDD